MTNVVNLNRYRKARQKASKKAQADRNAVAFGLTKAEREGVRAEKEGTEKALDGKVIQKSEDDANDASE
ncbi:MAG: DUF4169 family protein [Pseudomonadota bacterium]